MTDWATYASRRRHQTAAEAAPKHHHTRDGPRSDTADEPFDTESSPALPPRTLGDRLLGISAWAIGAAQYALPFVLTPVGGLTGLAYADVPGALAGALLALLVSLLLMPVARWCGWFAVRTVAGVVGGARRHLFVFALLALAAALLVMELRT